VCIFCNSFGRDVGEARRARMVMLTKKHIRSGLYTIILFWTRLQLIIEQTCYSATILLEGANNVVSEKKWVNLTGKGRSSLCRG
jgi:hypothetical protein